MSVHKDSKPEWAGVSAPKEPAGYFDSGLPYNRIGRGPRALVVLLGLVFENKPLPGFTARGMLGVYSFPEYTVYGVGRRPGLPAGYSLGDMACDYAAMIEQQFGGPVDVVGNSTGGSVALHLAAGHPHLVRRLVLHSAAHTLGDAAKEAQMRVAHLARRGEMREAAAVLLRFMMPRNWLGRTSAWLGSALMARGGPDDPSDLIVTVEAEDALAFRGRLAEIQAPTLVMAGDQDPFYSAALFRETAEGIPRGRLILYPGKGHSPGGKRLRRDLHAFLVGPDETSS